MVNKPNSNHVSNGPYQVIAGEVPLVQTLVLSIVGLIETGFPVMTVLSTVLAKVC